MARAPAPHEAQPADHRRPPSSACTCAVRNPERNSEEPPPSTTPRGPVIPALTDRIAFATDRDGNFEIYTANADGSAIMRLTHNPAPDRDPAWSPDGRQIAFVRLASVNDWYGDVYVMNADGSRQRRLGRGGSPAWSPDGTRIAYHLNVEQRGQVITALYVMHADGTSPRKVLDQAADPSWTPDGHHLIYGGLSGGIVNVFRAAVDGGKAEQLSSDPVFACEPDVSPDGRSVAYVASFPTKLHAEVLDNELEGSPITSGAIESGDWEFAPSWSPDGTLIAFERDPDLDGHYAYAIGGVPFGPLPSRIVIARADGSGEMMPLPAARYSDADPDFAPRGP